MKGVKRLRPIRAIVFDLDNTLVSSNIDYAKLKLAVLDELAKAGVPDSLLDEKDSVVENFIRGKDYLQGNLNESQLQQFSDRLDNILMRIELERVDQVREIEGAISLMNSLKESGYEVGILTRGSRGYATTILDRTGFNGQLIHLVCRDDYPLEEAKPNRLAMDRIAEKLHCRSEDCLFIGDHPMDLECAKMSGAAFVGVLTGSTDKEKWRQTGCESVIDSVVDLPRLLKD